MSANYINGVFFKGRREELEVSAVVDDVLGFDDGGGVVEGSDVRDRQVLVRVSEVQREQWQRAAEADGFSMSEWLRQLADARFRDIFLCSHPVGDRKVYPWSEFCLKCGVRLR